MLIFSVLFQIDQMPEGMDMTLYIVYIPYFQRRASAEQTAAAA